jgi:hypothetical protein
MAVMAREAWTDERLDDLSAGMDKGFGRLDADIREVRSEIREVRSDMKKGFDEMNVRFDSMQRTMIIGFVTLFASIVASVIGGLLATQL